MLKVSIIDRVIKAGHIHSTIIKQVASKIEYDCKKHRINKKYQEVIEHGGSKFFTVFEFLGSNEVPNEVLVREMRHSK
jgi:hypothetical protein